MLHAISLGLVLSALWLLLSGYFLGLILGLGALSVALAVALAHRMDVVDHEGHPIHITWRVLLYWPWLLVEIVKSNIDVAKAILAGPKAIQPQVFDTETSQKTELGQVIYTNSITLTPGTITINLSDGIATVHALLDATAEGVKSGEMDRKVAAVEDPRIGPDPEVAAQIAAHTAENTAKGEKA